MVCLPFLLIVLGKFVAILLNGVSMASYRLKIYFRQLAQLM